MIFGFGKKKAADDNDDRERDYEPIRFMGTLNKTEIDLKPHKKLLEVGMDIAKDYVTDGVMRRAEVLRIEPKGERVATVMMIDGIAYPGDKLSRQEAMAVQQIMKLFAGLDPANRKTAQRGGLLSELDGKKYHLHVETSPLAGGGERMTIFVADPAIKLTSSEEVGIPEALKARIRALASEKKGIFLATGPSRSGTTTTLFALARCADVYIYSVYLLIESAGRETTNLPAFERNPGESLDEVLPRVLRVEADILVCDAVTTPEIAKTLIKYADEAAMMSEIAGRDALSGLLAFAEMSGDMAGTANQVKAVVSQKLIRKLCPDCKEPFRANPKLIQKAGLPEGTRVLYRQAGAGEDGEENPCEKCGGTGFFGRTGLFEIVEVNDEIKKLLVTGAGAVQIKEVVKKMDLPNFKSSGLKLVADGVTSLEELQRIFKA